VNLAYRVMGATGVCHTNPADEPVVETIADIASARPQAGRGPARPIERRFERARERGFNSPSAPSEGPSPHAPATASAWLRAAFAAQGAPESSHAKTIAQVRVRHEVRPAAGAAKRRSCSPKGAVRRHRQAGPADVSCAPRDRRRRQARGRARRRAPRRAGRAPLTTARSRTERLRSLPGVGALPRPRGFHSASARAPNAPYPREPTPGLEPGTPSLRVKCSTS
jgi:hypothetical protein